MKKQTKKSAPETSARPACSIRLGNKLFQFNDFEKWVNDAKTSWICCGVPADWTLAIDQKGRICKIGKHFMQARDENSFPVEVYAIRGE